MPDRESNLLTDEPRPAVLPISPAQYGMWFLASLGLLGSAYNIWFTIRMKGALNRGAMIRALREIVRRHESLRTRIVTVAGGAALEIDQPDAFRVQTVELSELSERERTARAQALIDAPSEFHFDLERDALFRATLARLAPDEHLLVLTMHHIIMDGWSIAILERELAQLYAAYANDAPSPLPEPSAQYADYALWQRRRLQPDLIESQLAYWREQLRDLPSGLALPTDRTPPAAPTFRGAKVPLALSAPLAEHIHALARAARVTPFVVFLAAFQVLLSRLSGQRDIVVGTVVTQRDHWQAEDLVGYFLNTLVLRANLSGTRSFHDVLRHVEKMLLEAYAHQDVPFDTLVAELRPSRELGRQPLFQVGFFYPGKIRESITLPGIEVTVLDPEVQTSKFDLSLFVVEREGQLECLFEYATDLFDRSTVERMAQHFATLTEALVGEPDAPIAELPLLGPAERHRILVDWNATATDFTPGACAHELFEAQAKRTPDAPAIEFDGRLLSYRELNARANQLAHHLRTLGVGPETLVGICVQRSLEMVVGLLAVLKAGGAYVPLDPAYPPERLAYMIADSAAAVLLTQSALLAQLPEHAAHAFCVDRDWPAVAAYPATDPVALARPANAAYCMYTSGSTGTPKGVVVPHEAIVAFLSWSIRTFGGAPAARMLFSASICFDPSVFELFTALGSGGSVLLVEHALALAQSPARGTVTAIDTVPSAIEALAGSADELASVRAISLAGEPLPRALADRIQAAFPQAELWNLYGSTETTYSACERVDVSPAGPVVIGRPIDNVQIYVLDAALEPVPVGVTGEIYIAGAALGRGYLRRPAGTAERFVPNPFGPPGSRMYETGDAARYLPDGRIEMLGRVDQQIKIRGQRVELGEIEAALCAQPNVREAVVLARQAAPSDVRLAAFVTAADGPLDISALRVGLSKRLPGYMLPGTIDQLARLPLTPTGKIDRIALAAMPPSGEERTRFVAPRTPTEIALAEIWTEVLGAARVGVRDNFFDLGGHSLAAIRVQSRIAEVFDVHVPVASFYGTPFLEDLAALVIARMIGDDAAVLDEALQGRAIDLAPG